MSRLPCSGERALKTYKSSRMANSDHSPSLEDEQSSLQGSSWADKSCDWHEHRTAPTFMVDVDPYLLEQVFDIVQKQQKPDMYQQRKRGESLASF